MPARNKPVKSDIDQSIAGASFVNNLACYGALLTQRKRDYCKRQSQAHPQERLVAHPFLQDALRFSDHARRTGAPQSPEQRAP